MRSILRCYAEAAVNPLFQGKALSPGKIHEQVVVPRQDEAREIAEIEAYWEAHSKFLLPEFPKKRLVEKYKAARKADPSLTAKKYLAGA